MIYEANSAQPISAFNLAKVHVSPTIGENIDRRIKHLEEEITNLRRVRDQMATSGLLEVRIDDLRSAMNY